jgi:histidinol dehydrogenase
MPIRLDSQSADFPERFRSLLALKREAAQDVEQVVRGIVADVASRGDTALFELTAKFDRIDLAKTGLRVTAAEIETAEKACQGEALSALKFARDRIEAYHRRQKPIDERFTDPLGVEMGAKWTAIEAVGLYVPGGTAAYPSSVLMNAVPAKVAGVPRLAMVVPAPRFIVSAAHRRWRHSPTEPKALRPLPRLSGPATPMSQPQSASCSARLAST